MVDVSNGRWLLSPAVKIQVEILHSSSDLLACAPAGAKRYITHLSIVDVQDCRKLYYLMEGPCARSPTAISRLAPE
jgi:hypothetical protein